MIMTMIIIIITMPGLRYDTSTAFVVNCEVDVFWVAWSLSTKLTFNFKQRFCRDFAVAAIQRVKAR